MKKIFVAILLTTSATFCFAQKITEKVNLLKGQKIHTQVTLLTEASLSPGMEINNNTVTDITLEVKDVAGKEIILSNTLTKLKVAMDIMGKSMDYDSDKPEDKDSQMGKLFADKINIPVEVKVDNTTGKPTQVKSPEKQDDEASNSMMSMMSIFGASTDDDAVSGAFAIIPQGKKVGDSWTDSAVSKTTRVIRNYTLQAINGNEATLYIKNTIDANSDIDFQGMQGTITTNAVATGDIITDITTAGVKKKSLITETVGNITIMGQEMPISAKTTYTATYQ